MITKHEHIRRSTCADMTITQVIRKALADNFERIPFTNEGGFIATGADGSPSPLRKSLGMPGSMLP